MPRGRKIKENEGPLYGFTNEEWASLHKNKRAAIRNPEAQRKAYLKWAATKDPEYHRLRARKSQLKLSYGITLEEYDLLLEQQDHSCAICKTKTPTGKWKVFAVDHCHITGNVRGLLCNECNRGMGLLRDDPDLLRKAAEYLDNNKKETSSGIG